MKDLIEKYLSGEATSAERDELLHMLRTDGHIEGWLRADMELSEGSMPEPVRERILSNILSAPAVSVSGRSAHRLSPAYTVAIAACTALVIICAVTTWLLIDRGQERPLSASQATPSVLVVSTGLGEHSRVTLPDGTEVTLNALTTLRYDAGMTGGKRCAEVEGEAYFEVAKDESHPFVVTASGVSVTCLGTAFDVRNYAGEDNVSVVLAEGKVRVSAEDADLTMEPDSRVVFDRRALTLSKHSVASSDYTCWLAGEVRYNNQTLGEIAEELSRNYHIDMIITSDELRSERFTGYLGRASLRNVLDVLCLAAGMNYYVDGDTTVYVYARK